MTTPLISRHSADVEVCCYDEVGWNAISLYVLTRHGPGKGVTTLTTPTEVAVSETYRPEPLLRLDMEVAQRLMDELWKCGLRPKEGTGSAGAMAATERHLADLQKLVERFVVPREESR